MNAFDPEQKTEGKRSIASHDYPLIGPYDSGDPAVIEYHLLLMKLAGIDGIIIDWYGLSDLYDYSIGQPLPFHAVVCKKSRGEKSRQGEEEKRRRGELFFF